MKNGTKKISIFSDFCLGYSSSREVQIKNTNTPLFSVYGYTDLQAAVTSLQFRTESRLCLPVYAHVSHDFTPHPSETRESLSGWNDRSQKDVDYNQSQRAPIYK